MASVDRETAARHAARRLFADDECEIDVDAGVTLLDEPGADEGAAWVQCWRLVPAESIDLVVAAAEAS